MDDKWPECRETIRKWKKMFFLKSTCSRVKLHVNLSIRKVFMFHVSYFNRQSIWFFKSSKTTRGLRMWIPVYKFENWTHFRYSRADVTNLNNLTSPKPTVLRISVLKILCAVEKHVGKTLLYQNLNRLLENLATGTCI